MDAVLEETRAVQRRLRDLPSRVGVCFLVAMCLFPQVGYLLVWDKLTAGIGGCLPGPGAKGLRDLRRRVGCAPVKALFEVVAGVLATPRTPGVRFGPYRTVSFNGRSSIKTPDSERNRGWLRRCPHGGYPQVELMTPVETGTRSVIGAVFGPTRESETSYATRLLSHLGPELLLLWDRGFDSNDFLAAVHATGARVVGRIRQRRRPPVLKTLMDSSYLSVVGGVAVRILEADVRVTCADGSTFNRGLRASSDARSGAKFASAPDSRSDARPARWSSDFARTTSSADNLLEPSVTVPPESTSLAARRGSGGPRHLGKPVPAAGRGRSSGWTGRCLRGWLPP